MSIPAAWPQVLDFFGTPPAVKPPPHQLSGGAGPPPVRQFDERSGLTRAFAEALDGPRNPSLTCVSGRNATYLAGRLPGLRTRAHRCARGLSRRRGGTAWHLGAG